MRRVILLLLTATASTPAIAAEPELAELGLPPGFRAELVYQVPRQEQGSWVCLASAGGGDLIASDQHGKLYRVTPSPLGGTPDATRVRSLPLDLGMAQGLAVHQGSLYVVVNHAGPVPASGLYRARDADGDGLWDQSELLRELQGQGEHGPHAVLPSADGKWLWVCCGNMTLPTEFADTRPARVWQEDSVLPLLADPMNFEPAWKPPGGWIAKCDLEGKTWTLHAIGFRNQYDIALDRHGELYTFDSDMEFDVATPWYRPTRICHVVSGADFGWRSSSDKWRPWYPDSYPAAIDIGPGSPTGLLFGYETNFPEPYRSALFAADWSHGRIFAVIPSPKRGPERGCFERFESFASAAPLPTTDLAANGVDGALYFTTGGRGVQSGLWRIVYEGPPAGSGERLAEAIPAERTRDPIRQRLESLHTDSLQANPEAMELVWEHLDSGDTLLRHAARVALEHQPIEGWAPRGFAEQPAKRIAACLAAARVGDPSEDEKLWRSLAEIEWNSLDLLGKQGLVRTYSVLLARHREPSAELALASVKQLADSAPTGDPALDGALVAVLVRVQPEAAVPLGVTALEEATLEAEKIDFAHALATTGRGWNVDLRRRYFQQLGALSVWAQGRANQGYVDQITASAEQNLEPQARESVADLIAERRQRLEAGKQLATRKVVTHWDLESALKALEVSGGSANLERGKALFAAARCAECHKHGEFGGPVGPDLTMVGKRFALRDMLEAMLTPDAIVSDQYQQTAFEIDGRVVVGRIVDLGAGWVKIATDYSDPKQNTQYPLEEIESQRPSKTSPMPTGLLDVLDAQELRDLVAYLRAPAEAEVGP